MSKHKVFRKVVIAEWWRLIGGLFFKVLGVVVMGSLFNVESFYEPILTVSEAIIIAYCVLSSLAIIIIGSFLILTFEDRYKVRYEEVKE